MSLITYVTRVHFADDVLEEAIVAETHTLGVKRPLIVTDTGIVECGIAERLLEILPQHVSPTVFDSTPSNPDEESCRRAANQFIEQDCDGIIALGGGSVIDLSKAAGLLATHDGDLASYAAIEGGTARIRDNIPALIAIPTTAGTGSEVGGAAVVIVADGRKLGILSQHLVPDVAICDPTLTIQLPHDLTAGTGMDAITHCVETYISNTYNPPADGIAIDGLARAFRNIERAVNDGRDINARREMMAAAMNGALAFQKGLGGVHAMSHALGGMSGRKWHHGKLNAILLPHVLEFNAPAAGQRYGDLRRAMGISSKADICNAFVRLNERIGLPSHLSKLGVDRKAIETAAPLAEKDHTNSTNPRMAGAADYLQLMTNAL